MQHIISHRLGHIHNGAIQGYLCIHRSKFIPYSIKFIKTVDRIKLTLTILIRFIIPVLPYTEAIISNKANAFSV